MKKAKLQYGSKLDNKIEIEHEEKKSLRLNKYISDSGVASRREADRLIAAGKVTIDGVIAEVGVQVLPGQRVSVNGQDIDISGQRVYIALNKPRGITCTTDSKVQGNVKDFMNYKETIFPIGRLDKDSSGLLLMTNDGDIVNKILREENGHDKLYEVQVDKTFDSYFLDEMRSGVTIYNPVAHKNQTTKPCEIKQIDDRSFYITLQQGLNRQIRRMTKALGYNVSKLKRVRVMHITLGDLKEGEYRYLTKEEMLEMDKRLKESESHTTKK